MALALHSHIDAVASFLIAAMCGQVEIPCNFMTFMRNAIPEQYRNSMGSRNNGPGLVGAADGYLLLLLALFLNPL